MVLLGLLQNGSLILYSKSHYLKVSPLIAPVTKTKIRFVDLKSMKKIAAEKEGTGTWANLLHYVHEDHLEHEFGGNFTFDYNHNVYWPALLETL